MFGAIFLAAILALAASSPTKRCAGLFDESCINGFVANSNNEDYLAQNGLGKRCANLFDESCTNGGLAAANQEDWLAGNSLGKRAPPQQQQSPAQMMHSLSELFHRAHMVATKRCANLFDESCAYGKLPAANAEEWLGQNSLGK